MWDLDIIKRMNKATPRQDVVMAAKEWAEVYRLFYQEGLSYAKLLHQEEALALAVANLREEEEIATS